MRKLSCVAILLAVALSFFGSSIAQTDAFSTKPITLNVDRNWDVLKPHMVSP